MSHMDTTSAGVRPNLAPSWMNKSHCRMKNKKTSWKITIISDYLNPSVCTFSAVRFQTVTTCPIFNKLETTPLPISPSPRNPILLWKQINYITYIVILIVPIMFVKFKQEINLNFRFRLHSIFSKMNLLIRVICFLIKLHWLRRALVFACNQNTAQQNTVTSAVQEALYKLKTGLGILRM